MKSPEDIVQWVQQRYLRQRWRWLDGHGTWPLQVPLGRPTQKVALSRPDAVKSWSTAWAAWLRTKSGAADAVRPELITATLSWPSVGPQTLPESLTFRSPETVAEYCGDGHRWRRIVRRRDLMLARWPTLAASGFGFHYEILATYDDRDFARLLDLLVWLLANRRSGLYLRQLPVPGIDTKWVDKGRRGIAVDLLRRITRPNSVSLQEDDADESDAEQPSLEEMGGDFYETCGLRRPPAKLHMVILCPELRAQIGGLRDVESTIEDWAQAMLEPRQLLVIENRDTGLCLPDIPGVLAIIKLGNSVSLIQQLPWLSQVPILYWGDIDTYGYSILAQARRSLSNVRSVLMDEATLTSHLDRLVSEGEQARNVDKTLLAAHELRVYEGLLAGTWGASKRLEQERLEWPIALRAVLEALSGTDVLMGQPAL